MAVCGSKCNVSYFLSKKISSLFLYCGLIYDAVASGVAASSAATAASAVTAASATAAAAYVDVAAYAAAASAAAAAVSNEHLILVYRYCGAPTRDDFIFTETYI